MRILIVGSNLGHALEQHFIKYLPDRGAVLSVFDAPDIVHAAVSKQLLKRVLFRTGLKTGYSRINTMLLAEAERFSPDVILVFKGMEIYPRTLRLLKSKGIKLANYNPDHPFIISGPGSGNSNVTKSVSIYDLHFCYHGPLMEEIRHKYHIPVVALPFGYELPEAGFAEAAQQEEINRVCLIGTGDRDRAAAVSLIAQSGYPVDVYGNSWKSSVFSKYPNVTVHKVVYGQAFWNNLRRYRVQLNIFRKHNIGSHNMRSFEVPAVGGILLTPYSAEQASFFENGKEVFFYRDEKNMLDTIGQLLAMSPAAANAVRTAARNRSLLSAHSYADRANTVFNAFEKLLKA